MTFQEVINSIDFSFLKSNRFWAVVIIAVVTYLHTKGYLGVAETVLINTIFGVSAGIRTIDRFGEYIGKR